MARHPLVVAVEGPLDAIAVTAGSGGVAVGVAPLGTAFTVEQLARLPRGCDLVCATDADPAGFKAAQRLFTVAAARNLDPGYAPMPRGSAPADVLATAGPAELLRLLTADAAPLSQVLIAEAIRVRMGDEPDKASAESRVAAVRNAAQIAGLLKPTYWERDIAQITALTDVMPETVHREVVLAGTARVAPVITKLFVPSAAPVSPPAGAPRVGSPPLKRPSASHPGPPHHPADPAGRHVPRGR
jgi:DNA primase